MQVLDLSTELENGEVSVTFLKSDSTKDRRSPNNSENSRNKNRKYFWWSQFSEKL